MSSHPLEFPDVKEYRAEATSQLSSILPTITKPQAKGSSSSTSRDAGQRIEAVSLGNLPRLIELMDNLPEGAQFRTAKGEVIEITEMRAFVLSERAHEAEEKFRRLGNTKDIDEAIECRSQALSLTPDGHEAKPIRIGTLGTAFWNRFARVGDLTDINKAVEHLTQAVELIPDGHGDKLTSLNNLGITYASRFQRLGELEDLNKAIKYKTQALLLAPDGDPTGLNNLGTSYMARFERLGELASLNEAIECFSQAVLLTPDGHPHKASLLNNLGSSYESRFRQLGELLDLNKAFEYKTTAALLTPDGHPDKPSRLSSLGAAFLSQFGRLGMLTDLSKAIEYFTNAVQLTPDGHPYKAVWLNNLGISYQSRFRRLGKIGDLNKAIEYETGAVQLTPDGHPDKPSQLTNLGNSYESRFKRLGELPDLTKAIDYHTQAVLLSPDGHASRPNWLNNLGISYKSRFGRLGNLTDVNKAIQYQTQAVLLTPDEHSNKPHLLTNLAISYESRFRRLGEPADLNKAIEYFTQVVLLTPDGHPGKHTWLNNLGTSYHSRFNRLGTVIDLNTAIQYQNQAVLLIPDGHPDKPGWLSNLGVSYDSRFRRLGEHEDADKAIEYLTQAVMLTPDGHATKPSLLDTLGGLYNSRFQQLGGLSDSNEAIKYGTQALALTPEGYIEQPNRSYHLGSSYHSRYEHLGDLSDLRLAQSLFENGAQLTLIHPRVQSRCARKWAQCSLLLGSSPLSAYERCMDLIPHLIWLGTTIDQRYSRLDEINDLATEAAAWAISIQAFDLALEWLDAGRSIVWNQILQLRTPFDELALVDPVLARGLKDTAFELETAVSRRSGPLSHDISSDVEEGAQQHHRLAAKWEQLLADARKIPGFENFLHPRKASELMLSATDGPVVVLNAHSTRCDALVLFPGCDKIAHLPLSNISLAKLGQYRVQLQTLVGHRGDRAGGFKLSKSSPKSDATFQSILAVCWADVVQPVLDILGFKDVPAKELPHVTWCTTGALSFLPLHAAGIYDGLQPNTPDLIISSYTPTLSALLSTDPPGTFPHSGVLAVGQEYTSGFCPLPNTVHELAAIKEHARVTQFLQLDGTSATVDAVLGAMESHAWVHLACHASQHPDIPAQSAFHLHDGPLTLETITKRSFKKKGLAFLSACQTATGDEKLADEAVHLAAGMLMAGYPSVIATMWSIQDEDGPMIAGAVYKELLKDGEMDHRRAAGALHKAVAGLRETVGDEAFERWVPFVHIGV